MNFKVCALPLVLYSAFAFAQDAPTSVLTKELLPIWQKHALVADGATNPQAIPYGIATERLFWNFERARERGGDTLRAEVRLGVPASDNDLAAIADAASQSRQIAADVRNESLKEYDSLCESILRAAPETLDAVAVAESFTAIQAAEAARLSAHYREVVSRLSPAAQAGLNSYVDANIRSELRWGPDLVGLALEVPQAFLATRKDTCERRLSTPVEERLWRYERRSEVIESER